ncbi:MAG: DUF2849 domain-containing protein [Parvularculaceae bacterium]|nr:DUF2849 domain-containing protein [Parvularculaceae bacterium]
MKAITANRLYDGVVLYVGPNGGFVERFEQAALFDEAAANAELEVVLTRDTAIASAYVIEADASGPIGREALRESIRRYGPTIRKDLGKQSEAANERL